MRKFWFLMVAYLAVHSAAQAAPLEAKLVGRDAQWLAHVDIDAARDSTLGKRLQEQLAQREDVQAGLERLREEIGFDPTKDLHGVTLYGVHAEEPRGVVLLHASVDRDVVVERLSEKREYEEKAYNGVKLHSWTEWRRKQDRPVTAAFLPDDLILFGRFPEDVIAAIDVVEGRKPNLQDAESALTVPVEKGTIFLVRAVELSESKLPMRSPLLKKSEELSLTFGEDGETTFARAVLKAQSEEVVEQVAAMVEGVRAMIALRGDEGANLQAALGGLQTTSEGTTIEIEWRVPTELLVKIAQEERAKRAARRKSKTE